jgi:hypothetical protein
MGQEDDIEYWRIPATEEELRERAEGSGRTIEEERDIDIVRRRWLRLKVEYEKKQRLQKPRSESNG